MTYTTNALLFLIAVLLLSKNVHDDRIPWWSSLASFAGVALYLWAVSK
ncbi:MAG: hypothetical protein WBE45_21355 [Terriglobales bacterium]